MAILVSNQTARRVFLTRQGLAGDPSRKQDRQGLLELIHDLGFVQVDSIQTVNRAHEQILFSRNQTFSRENLRRLLEEDRALFEHWTHDASIIPTAFYPYWKHSFVRKESAMRERWKKWHGEGFDKAFVDIYDRVAQAGEVLAREMKDPAHKSGGWWQWHPSKTALEFYWQTGKFAISRRENFQKVYDLAERVIPDTHRSAEVTHEEFIDWACRGALERLGFATHGEMAAFWGILSPQEAREWVSQNRDQLTAVEIAPADGGKPRLSYAMAGIDFAQDAWPEPPGRVRILSPFDPLLRDRNRTERLFGFRYRIEVFVPEAKREYGYYVFPLLEGDRLIGRIDARTDRKEGALNVSKLWLEPGVRASAGRLQKLEAELRRIARFAGVGRISYANSWNEN